MLVPHIDDPQRTCLTCHWFQFPSADAYAHAQAAGTPPPLRNRGCMSPTPIRFSHGACHHWRHYLTRWDRVGLWLRRQRPRRRSIIR